MSLYEKEMLLECIETIRVNCLGGDLIAVVLPVSSGDIDKSTNSSYYTTLNRFRELA